MRKHKPIKFKINEKTGCHECTSHAKCRDGYCRVKIKGKSFFIHRYVYELLKKPIKKGNVIMHTCDNPSCINPNHLIQGKQKENIADRDRKKRTARGTKNGRSKLNEKQVIEIFKEEKLTNYRLGKIYGVNESTIRDIRKGKNWASVTNEFLRSKIKP